MKSNNINWLTQVEANKLLKQYWKNIIVSSDKVSPMKILIFQFKDPLALILLWAFIFSYFIGEILEGVIIFIVILINALIWFYQEYKAEKWVEALKKMLSYHVKVLRDWQYKKIKTEDIVPWDIIELYEWDKVPADGQILSASDFRLNESALTWESIFILKDTWEVFMWTLVVKWKAIIEIKNTWMNTRFGQIASLVSKTEEQKSPIEKDIEKIWKYIWVFVWIITLLIFLYSIYKNWFKYNEIFESFIYSVSIAVAAVPEWLSTTMLIVMAIASSRLASENALLKKLKSVWTLWWVSVICTDKTWTLTKNQMTVSDIFTSKSFYSIWVWDWIESFISESNAKNDKDLKTLIQVWVLCNESSLVQEKWKTKIIWDPTEWCLLVLAKKYWFDVDLKNSMEHVLTFFFDSQRKMMTSIYKNNWEVIAYSKWAFESIVWICTHIQENWKVRKINNKDIWKIQKEVESYQKNALRVLSFSYKKLEKKWKYEMKKVEEKMIFVWITWIFDPPREEVFDAIIATKKAWIKVFMLTWDAKETAVSIAKKIWLVEEWNFNVFLWEDIMKIRDLKLKNILLDKKIPIFARIDPVLKKRIVEILQKSWERVAVTWDWVNDAPALKKADIGVVMWIEWTDVAKESADLILLDDSFATIEVAVTEGRRIYENMKKFIYYIFSTNLWELVLIIWALIMWLKNPMSPILILIINLLTDVLPALALWVEKVSDDIIYKKPTEYWNNFFNRFFIFKIIFSGVLIWIFSILIFIYFSKVSYAYSMTSVFAWIVIMQVLNSYNAKSLTLSIFSSETKSNIYLYFSSILWLWILFFIVQTDIWNNIFKTVKLDNITWIYLFLISLVFIFIEEIKKLIFRN